jgi:hypothetical protein
MRYVLTLETGQQVLLDQNERSWNMIRGDADHGLSHGSYIDISPLREGFPLCMTLPSGTAPVHRLTFARIAHILTAERE